MQSLAIPQHRDPVARAALVACAFALIWLTITSALPQASAQEQPQQQVVIVVATPTLPASLPEAAPGLAAATAAPADPVAVAVPADSAAVPPQPNVGVADADPQLEIERAAAEAYRQLPTAAPPSVENQQPVTVRRPHTGR